VVGLTVEGGLTGKGEQFSSECLTVCVVNYNGEHLLEECLGSIFAASDRIQEILLIDNGSQDNSIKLVDQLFPAAVIIALGENRGPGAARNVGLQRASCSRVLFVDNDVAIAPECIESLCKSLDDHPEAALAMPSVRFHHNREKVQFDGADCHYLGLMILHNTNVMVDKVISKERTINTIVTACFMIDRSRTGSNHFFDESFVFNYEDFDFGLRTRLLGREIVSVPAAHCYHQEGTEGLSYRPGRGYPKRRVRYLIRNRWQTVLKCYRLRTLLLLFPMLLVYEIFQLIGVFKKGWALKWLRSVFWLAFHLPAIFSKRQAVQASRRTTDAAILQNAPLPFTDDLAVGRTEKWILSGLNTLSNWYWDTIGKYI
jgi:GT2 family glycosyltransferase